jgi:uncharacterized membrane-anchored protein YitT (DUF2179 family)
MPVAAKVSEMEYLCCSQLSPSRKRLLRKFSPHQQPKIWLLINVFILIWSTILFIEFIDVVGTLNEDAENDEKTYAELQYLIWNFGTCLLWVIEVGLNIFDFIDSKEELGENSLLQHTDRSITNNTQNETLPLWFELSLAFYFLIDSVVYRQFVDMRQSKLKENGQMTIDSGREIV